MPYTTWNQIEVGLHGDCLIRVIKHGEREVITIKLSDYNPDDYLEVAFAGSYFRQPMLQMFRRRANLYTLTTDTVSISGTENVMVAGYYSDHPFSKLIAPPYVKGTLNFSDVRSRRRIDVAFITDPSEEEKKWKVGTLFKRDRKGDLRKRFNDLDALNRFIKRIEEKDPNMPIVIGIDKCEMPKPFHDDTRASWSGGWVPIIPIEPIGDFLGLAVGNGGYGYRSPCYVVSLKGQKPILERVVESKSNSEDEVCDIYFPSVPSPMFADDKVYFERDTVAARIFTANGIPIFNHLTNYRAHLVAKLMIRAIEKLEAENKVPLL